MRIGCCGSVGRVRRRSHAKLLLLLHIVGRRRGVHRRRSAIHGARLHHGWTRHHNRLRRRWAHARLHIDSDRTAVVAVVMVVMVVVVMASVVVVVMASVMASVMTSVMASVMSAVVAAPSA